MTFDTASVWPPCPASFNMAAHVLQAGAQHPNKSALLELARDGSVRKDWSYGQLITAVRGTAAGLISAGARPGDHVLMRLGNRADFPITYLAAIAAGLVAVPTSPDLTDAEITAMSAVIQPKLVLQDPRISAPRDHAATVISSDDLRTFHNLPPQPWHMGDPGRPAYIVFTSGTSGAPRAVVHGHRAIWARGMMHDGWYGLKEQDHLMHAGAFNWTFTLGTGLMDPWTKGATALIPAPGTPPDMLGRLLANHEVTLFAAAPGVLRKMLQAHIPPLPDLRHALCAGEKLPEAIRASWKTATGTEIYEAFGMSECSTFLSASPGKPAATGTLGRPQPGRQIALLDETGARSPDGDVGEICVHKSDPGLMLEYFGAPQA
ncbi:MAG: long-chain fatty acid--CoA ligase, partial [Pseudomonadota bacterium]